MMQVTELTLKSWKTSTEGQFFDRKSGRLAPKDLASHISAFANASGGIIILGIEDDGRITGVNQEQENQLRQAGITYLDLLPEFDVDSAETKEGERLLVVSVQPSHNMIVKTKTGDAYLRVGDQS